MNCILESQSISREVTRTQPGPALPSLRPLVTSSGVAGGVEVRLDPDPPFQQGTSGSWLGLLGDRGSADRAGGQAERGGSRRTTQQRAGFYQNSIRPPPTDPRNSRPVGHRLPLQIGSPTTRRIGAHSHHSLKSQRIKGFQHSNVCFLALEAGGLPKGRTNQEGSSPSVGMPQGLERASFFVCKREGWTKCSLGHPHSHTLLQWCVQRAGAIEVSGWW